MRARRLAAAALLSLAAAPVAADPGSDLPARIEAKLDAFRDRYGFPGSTAAIALPNGTVAAAASGLADVEARAMTAGTRMLAASIGKTFVAATVLALESEGRLARAERPAEHLADHPWDAEGRLVWDPGVEWTGGGLASTSHDLARWGHALFGGATMGAPYLLRLLDGVPVAPDVLYGAGVEIYADTLRSAVYGHGGWIPAYVSSLRHYADQGVTVAFQINSDGGAVDDSSDLVPALEAALADLTIDAAR